MNKYPIDSNSIVLEIGAYEDQWAKEILTNYHPKEMYLFEPQKWAYDVCIKKFMRNDNVKIFNFALWVHTKRMFMGDFQSDGASLMKNAKEKCDQRNPIFEEVDVIEIGSFLKSNRVGEIDLCHMNIEGGEYQLVPYILGNGIMDRIKYFSCQFHMHPWFPGEEAKIETMIDKTHKRITVNDGTFVEWERK